MNNKLRMQFQLAIRSLLNKEKLVVLGPRGAGKTVFVKSLLSMINRIENSISIYFDLNYEDRNCLNLNKIIYKKILEILEIRFKKISYFVRNSLRRFLKSNLKKDLESAFTQIKSEYDINIILIGDNVPNSNWCRRYLQLFTITISSIPLNNLEETKARTILIAPLIKDLTVELLRSHRIKFTESAIYKLNKYLGNLPRYISILLPYFKQEVYRDIPIDGSLIDNLIQNETIKTWMMNIASQHDKFYKRFYNKCYNDLIYFIINNSQSDIRALSIINNRKECLKALEMIGLLIENKGSYSLVDKPLEMLYKTKKTRKVIKDPIYLL